MNMQYKVYSSDRFIITGNAAYRLVVTDLQADKSYVIMFKELDKFREIFPLIKKAPNKDKFILALLSHSPDRSKS